jgi:FkbM family methyltransferase
LYLLGLRPRPRRYGTSVRTVELPGLGTVRYAQWLHPKERAKPVTPELLAELRRYLAPGDVALDIGAHTGDTTLPLALVVGVTGAVLALEPNPYVFPVLAETAALNPHLTRILPLPYAAAARDEELEFEYSDAGFCNGGLHPGISRWRHGHAFRLKVQGRDLPALLARDYPELLPRLRWVKTDTEGADFEVLQTLAPLLRRLQPFIRAEVYEHLPPERRRQMYRFLAELGYSVHRYDGDTRFRGAQLAETDMTRWRHFDVFCVPANPAERTAA